MGGETGSLTFQFSLKLVPKSSNTVLHHFNKNSKRLIERNNNERSSKQKDEQQS